MAINNAMKMALKALSYNDVKEHYKLRRAAGEIKAPHVLVSLFAQWDRFILGDDGREIMTRLYPAPRGGEKRFVLFFHGGGWVTESVNTYNAVCRTIAKELRCQVLSVGYRLAPEHRFPLGFNDCYEVARLVYTQPELFGVAPENIVLMGDSAGGNLAAAVSLRARDTREFTVPRQVLLYPATYSDHSENSPFASIRENGTDYLLTANAVCDYMDLYQGQEADYQNPYFAPLLAGDFSNQPNTLVISAEFDPLRDEGEAYAKCLKLGGSQVELYRMKDSLHGFFSMGTGFPHVRMAYDVVEQFLLREGIV